MHDYSLEDRRDASDPMVCLSDTMAERCLGTQEHPHTHRRMPRIPLGHRLDRAGRMLDRAGRMLGRVERTPELLAEHMPGRVEHTPGRAGHMLELRAESTARVGHMLGDHVEHRCVTPGHNPAGYILSMGMPRDGLKDRSILG